MTDALPHIPTTVRSFEVRCTGLVTDGALTTAALDAPYRRGVSVAEHGAKGDGATDDTAAIQAAATAAAQTADGSLYFPAGRYRTSDTVYIHTTLNASEAQIDYYGTGTALVIGSNPATPTITARRSFDLPRVRNRLRTGSAWDGTSTGVRLVNLNTCQITVPFIQDFECGLVIEGADRGCAYNTITLGAIWECRKGITFPTTGDGYTTQNLILGGRLQLSYSKNQVRDDPGACQVELSGNNNTFLNTSFETDGVPRYIVDISGSFHQLINCRWESQNGAVPRVIYRSNALRNLIQGGYEAGRIEETFEGTSGGGQIFDGAGGYSRASLGGAQTFPSGHSPRGTVLWAPQVGRRITQDVAQGRFTPRPGRWRVNAQVTFDPNPNGRRAVYLLTGSPSAPSVMATFEVPPSANRTTMPITSTRSFNGATQVWVEVMQTSGEPLGLETSGGYNVIEFEYLGN